MHAMLPDNPKIRLMQSTDKVTKQAVSRFEHLAVLVPKGLKAKAWKAIPSGGTFEKLLRRSGPEGEAALWRTRLDNTAQTGITLGFLDVDASPFETLSKARELIAEALKDNPARLGLLASGFEGPRQAQISEGLVAATWAAAFRLPSYKQVTPGRPRLKSVSLLGLDEPLNLDRTLAEAEGNNLARWLTALPSNELTPPSYRARVEVLAAQCGWQMKFLSERRLEQIKAGAFLAVAQGNESKDSGIVLLRYRPKGAKKKIPVIALVGKGICFDTGGTNLKPAKAMLQMHQDMQGSAVALGALLSLTRLAVDFGVDCWLAITENRPGPRAYKPQDVIKAKNGTSIQIINTDAEGRMILADTLTLAAEAQPRLIVDYATLTGACVAALTTRYSGIFSNRAEIRELLLQAGQISGERVWPFPMDPDFDGEIRSDVADIMQCGVEGSGDHIAAARFLSRFVPNDMPWVHIDLSAGRHKGGLGHIPTDITGFGVRLTLNLLLSQRLHERAAQEAGSSGG